MAERFERFTQAVVERFRPEIKKGSLENFIETARLAGAKEVLAKIGKRKVSVHPEVQEPISKGFDIWEFYTEFTAKGLWGKRITFDQTNDVSLLQRVDHALPRVKSYFNNSVLKTDKTRRILSDQGFKVTIKHKGIAYSEDEFAQLVGKARLIGSFVGY